MRLKSLLFSLLMLAGFSMAQATVVEIGTSANNDRNGYFPVNAHYDYSLTQQIYRFYELRNVPTISSISFYNTSATTTRQIDLYLTDSSSEYFSSETNWRSITNENKYFSGSVTFQQGEWTTITLDREYSHNTGYSLVVTVDDNTSSYTSSTYFKVGFNNFYYGSLYLFRDGTDWDVSQMSSYSGGLSYVRNQIRLNGAEKVYGLPNIHALPTHTNWKYCVTQQIYTMADIGKTGFINSIAFKNLSTDKTRNLDVYLVPTNKTEFSGSTDWVSVSESNKVFSGNVTFAEDEWATMKFQTPFYYDGTKKLAVVVYDHTGRDPGNHQG